ncbi:helix-turn-helix transcriptional regulator, partial [Rhodococcus sp. EPR-157]|uniref:helix-turn-helix transcriptional regulator n=1 Tax=Rhodococcus sp. EPR-157 TaxID=1813677 RepID=UPI000AD6041E
MSNTEPGETRGSAAAREWAADTAKRIGGAVAHYRKKRDISAVELSSRTTDLGYPITRGTIAKIEGGHRGGKFDVVEVFILAAALEVPPALLMFPEFPDGPVSPVPTSDLSSFRAALWLVGEETITWQHPDPRFTPEGVAYTVRHQSDEEQLFDLARQRGKAVTMDDSVFHASEIG